MNYRAYRYSHLKTDELKWHYCEYYRVGCGLLEMQSKERNPKWNYLCRRGAMTRFINMHEIHRELLRRGE